MAMMGGNGYVLLFLTPKPMLQFVGLRTDNQH